MPRARKNPFKFGTPVEGDYYFPRKELTKTVRQFLENRIHVVLIGPRRFGKTSFILNLLDQFHDKNTTSVFFDIFNVTSHKDFLLQFLRVLRSKKTWTQKFKTWVEGFSKLRPRLSWEADAQTGETSLSMIPEVLSDKDTKELIQDALSALKLLGKNVVVAIDEFQTIAELDDDGWLEATIRSHMQQAKNVAFLFSGSRRGIIHDMLDHPSRPFYRSCQPIEFLGFDQDFSDWIVQRFRSVDIACDVDAIDELRSIVQNTPNYIQMACYHLVAQGVRRVNKTQVAEILALLVKQNAYVYQTLLNSVTAVQQRVLRMAALGSEGIFSKERLARFELSSGPAVASAIKSLKKKQILDEDTARGSVLFDDPLFALWLKIENLNG